MGFAAVVWIEKNDQNISNLGTVEIPAIIGQHPAPVQCCISTWPRHWKPNRTWGELTVCQRRPGTDSDNHLATWIGPKK